MNSQLIFLIFTSFLAQWNGDIIKRITRESHNSLKLSFTNIQALASNSVGRESLLKPNSCDIVALCETNFGWFNWLWHYGTSFYMRLISSKLSGFLFMGSTDFIWCLTSFSSINYLLCALFLVLFHLTQMKFCKSTHLLMHLSLETLINIYHKVWVTYSGGTDRSGELCYNFSLVSVYNQLVNFPTQIPDYEHSPALLHLFLSSDPSICSTKTFPPMGNFKHFCLSFQWFSFKLKKWYPFHCTAHDHSCGIWNGLCD